MSFSFFDRPADLHKGAYARDATELEEDIKLPFAMTTFVWSPCVWLWGHRCKANFLYADWLGMDFDDGDPTLDSIMRELSDHKRIIGVTKSHQLEKNGKTCDRFRVAIPFERRIESLDEFEATMADVKKRYPTIDGAALLASQYFRPCRKLVESDYTDPDLYSWPVSAARPKTAFVPPAPARPGDVPFHTPAIMRLFAFNGKDRHKTLRAAATSMASQGFGEADIQTYMMNAIPTSRDFTDKEKIDLIKSCVAYTGRS